MERITITKNNVLYEVQIEHWLNKEQLWKAYSVVISAVEREADLKEALSNECGLTDVKIIGGFCD